MKDLFGSEESDGSTLSKRITRMNIVYNVQPTNAHQYSRSRVQVDLVTGVLQVLIWVDPGVVIPPSHLWMDVVHPQYLWHLLPIDLQQ